MFISDDPDELRSQIDDFQVPMFIAERLAGEERFRMLGLNEAHERLSGMRMEKIFHQTPWEFLPTDQANDVNARFSLCASSMPSFRYQTMLQMPSGPIVWDSTLQHVRTPEGHDRIIGSSVCVRTIRRDQRDTTAFEDVRYFSTEASFKLNQVAAVFEAAQSKQINAEQITDSAMVLAGICRSIDASMSKIRQMAEDRLAADAMPQVHLLDPAKDAAGGVRQKSVQQAASALIELMDQLPYPASENGRGVEADQR